MYRLAHFDVSRQFLSRRSKVTAQIVFGVMCGAAMIGLRALFDMWAPISGPFAMIYPAVLLATLYGHWRAGVMAFIVSFLWAWIFVLPMPHSLTFADPTDGPRVMLNAICALIVLVFAEAFRRAAHSTFEEIREAADRRLTLLAEIEHRTKNNFALVASLLEIHKRRVNRPELDGAIDDAVGRVRTFAEAYSNLAGEQDEGGEVPMKAYLDHLLDRIEKSALPSNITLYREIEPMMIERETAVALGLYVNEAISNSAKYAYPDNQPGTIAVVFHIENDEWHLTVEDDGAGLDASPEISTGLGSTLMEAFASQAGATHRAGPILGGYRTEMRASTKAVA